MYPDPKRVRNHKHTVRLDDYEQALITALANYQGEQVAVLIRAILMREAAAVLGEQNTAILDRAGA
ncbi:hypothetical protein [Burkholderia gladioli]|jgi:uncharacterized protein (DUF1778 family)|uniref:hypothetical protein n=1 Tax=Burkholderia gladioli TaxID=28095 RepID=UPI00164151D1|nr:hypothetical protein [Burkholderia gladioli]